MAPSHHLLVIDDEPFIGRMIAVYFAGGPFRVSTTEDGAGALAFLRANQDVELVLADIGLPGRSGLEVMEEAQHDPALRRIPWIVLTATGETASRERAVALGAAGFVTKPFSPRGLYRQVCELVGEPVGGEETH